VLEADLKNFFGSLSHEWMLRFVEHRVGDPRLISLIRRWLKASILEDGEIHANEEGTPQGGSISVLLSNVYRGQQGRNSYWSPYYGHEWGAKIMLDQTRRSLVYRKLLGVTEAAAAPESVSEPRQCIMR
jgi:hypothetical protein